MYYNASVRANQHPSWRFVRRAICYVCTALMPACARVRNSAQGQDVYKVFGIISGIECGIEVALQFSFSPSRQGDGLRQYVAARNMQAQTQWRV